MQINSLFVRGEGLAMFHPLARGWDLPTVRSSLVFSFIERYSGLLVTVASMMVLSRILTPRETGLYSVGAGIINIAQCIRDFGVSNYIMQEKELTHSRLATALAFSLGVGIIIAIIFDLGAGFISNFYSAPRLKIIIWILSLNFILVGFGSIGAARLRRDMNFRANLRISFASTLGSASISVLLAELGFGPFGLAWASLVNVLITLIGTTIVYGKDSVVIPGLKEWRRVFRFGVLATGGSLLQGIGERSPDIIIGRMLGVTTAGLYSRGNGLITLFEQAFMSAISPVALSTLARIKRNDEEMEEPYLQILSYVIAVAWPALAMMSILALPMIYGAFGFQWFGAVPIARILCLAAAFDVIGASSSTFFNAVGVVRKVLVVQAISVPVLVVSMLVGASFSATAAAWGFVAASAIRAAYSQFELRKLVQLRWDKYAGILGHSLLVTAGTVALPLAIVLTYGITMRDLWIPSFAAGVLGVCSWLVMIFVTGHPVKKEISLLASAIVRFAEARWSVE